MTVKIHNGRPQVPLSGSRPDQVQKKPEQNRTETVAAGDKVKISTFARKATEARQGEILNDPARAQRVAELKQQIADGTYNPDPQKVAESLLKYLREQD